MSLSACTSADGQAIGPDKKLIKYGQDNPTSAFVRENAKLVDFAGYDGITLDVHAKVDGKFIATKWGGWFTPRPWTYENFQHVVDDMKATNLTQAKTNFLDVMIHISHLTHEDGTRENLEQLDWFSDNFEITINNLALAARIAKDAGLRGLVLDVEMYGQGSEGPWRQAFNYAYASTVHKHEMPHTFEECVEQVRKRGREIGQAITAEYPDIHIFVLPDVYRVVEVTKDVGKAINPELTGLSASQYALYPAFLDGLLEGTGPEVRLFDGFEHSYGWTIAEQFEKGRAEFEAAAELAADPKLFRRKFGVSFGIWIDHRGWSTKPPFYENHFTPGEFQHAVHNALKYSDTYAWVWSEHAVTFGNVGVRAIDPNVPDVYRAALRNARRAQAPNFERDDRGAKKEPLPPSARKNAQNSDAQVFGGLNGQFDYLADLNSGWIFYADDLDVGIGYYSQRTWDTSKWVPIEVGEFFENQGHVFNGMAWYRNDVEIPAEWEGRQIEVHFGGIAGGSHIYVNGLWLEPLKIHPTGVQTWDITPNLKFGEVNTIVLQNHNPTGPGGVYRSVKLASPKK